MTYLNDLSFLALDTSPTIRNYFPKSRKIIPFNLCSYEIE
jgi:hypothetical protein